MLTSPARTKLYRNRLGTTQAFQRFCNAYPQLRRIVDDTRFFDESHGCLLDAFPKGVTYEIHPWESRSVPCHLMGTGCSPNIFEATDAKDNPYFFLENLPVCQDLLGVLHENKHTLPPLQITFTLHPFPSPDPENVLRLSPCFSLSAANAPFSEYAREDLFGTYPMHAALMDGLSDLPICRVRIKNVFALDQRTLGGFLLQFIKSSTTPKSVFMDLSVQQADQVSMKVAKALCRVEHVMVRDLDCWRFLPLRKRAATWAAHTPFYKPEKLALLLLNHLKNPGDKPLGHKLQRFLFGPYYAQL